MRPLQRIQARLGRHTELVKRRTLITLTLVTVVLLWLLKPNQNLLLSLLEQSEDPAVAAAFIRAMQQQQSSAELDFILAKQQYRAGESLLALEQLQPLEKFVSTPYWSDAHQLYAVILLNLSTDSTAGNSESARQQLTAYLSNLPDELPPAQLQLLAGYALQIGEPALALQLSSRAGLQPPEHMLALALAADKPGQAAHFARQLYQAEPTQQHLLQLLPILESVNQGQQALALARTHLQQQRCDTDCLQYLTGLALRNNATAVALAVAGKKAEQTRTVSDLLQASRLAEANAELALATRYLEQVSAMAPGLSVYQKLHQYYRWQQQTDKALAISRKLVQLSKDPAVIYAGLADALAESDLSATADFYYALARQVALSDEQIRALVDASDKAYGAADTVGRLEQLLSRQGDNPRLIAQLARFYQFSGQVAKAAGLWPRYQRATDPRYQRTAEPRYHEVQWFARAFNSLGQPGQALAILDQLARNSSPTTAQLEELLELAVYTANLPLQRYYQQQLLQQPDNALDPYLAVATHSEMSTEDRAFLWQLYQQSRALNILAALINYAIEHDDTALLTRVQNELDRHHQSEQQEVGQLQIYIALYRQDYRLARGLIKRQLQHPAVPAAVLQSAGWLALLLQDTDWLSSLYPALLRQPRTDAEQLRLLAAAARLLGRYQQAGYWQQLLARHSDYTALDRLNYALLAEHTANHALARQLRWQAVSLLSQQLITEPDTRLSYQSLLATLVSPAQAAATLLGDMQQQPSAGTLVLLAQGSLARNVAAQQFWQQQLLANGQQVNDSLALALALARRDHAAITALAYGDNRLTATERAGALTQIGHYSGAWQLLEQHNNPSLAVPARSPLQRLALALHPLRSHGVRAELRQLDSWQLQQRQLRYYRPLADGQWQLSADDIVTDDKQTIGSAAYQQLTLRWQTPLSDDSDLLSLGWLARQRLGRLQHGQQLTFTFDSSPRWRHSVQLSHQMSTEQSKNSFLFARENRLSWQPVWQLNRHQQLSATVAYSSLSTDFNEAIADQWQGQLRVSEQLSQAPQWQLYSQFDLQRSRLSTENFAALTAYTGQPFSAADFAAARYQRWSVGQQLARGIVGEPGPQMPHYRYLLDTSVGYNLVTSRLDVNLAAGVGIRLWGRDELFIKANWQSADRLGQENLSLNLGYFIDF